MADIIFPAFQPRLQGQRKALYAALLTDIVRAASDAIDSLRLFQELLRGNPKSSQKNGFMAFDAHGGDTGCHLRAGMILEAFTLHYRLSRDPYTTAPLAPSWIEDNIEHLENAQQRAREICAQLTYNRTRPSKLGFDAKDTHAHRVVRLIGWQEKDSTVLYRHPKCSSVDSATHDLKSSVNTDTRNSPDARPCSSADSVSSPSSTDISEDYDIYPLRTKWNIYDSRTMVRLIVYSFILSKYKTFFFSERTVAARLCPEVATDYGYRLMEGHWNFENPEYKKARVQRTAQEFRALQVWLSDLSCAWLYSLAIRCSQPTNMFSLLVNTTRRSGTGLSAVPCYPGYLLLREKMARDNIQIVMIDRHFCAEGVHFNIFIIDIACPPEDRIQRNTTLPATWHTRQATISELSSKPQPHPQLVAMGNSIVGSVEDYKARLSSPSPLKVHNESDCLENKRHIETFLQSDHDKLALSFFAYHRSYSFHLENGESEDEFVGCKMDNIIPGLRANWKAASEQLEGLGGGKGNMCVFGWQHVFLETKDRLASSIKNWVERGDLMPLSANVTNTDH